MLSESVQPLAIRTAANVLLELHGLQYNRLFSNDPQACRPNNRSQAAPPFDKQRWNTAIRKETRGSRSDVEIIDFMADGLMEEDADARECLDLLAKS
jgi:hypothetical protein